MFEGKTLNSHRASLHSINGHSPYMGTRKINAGGGGGKTRIIRGAGGGGGKR